jgi:hypothetical protein
LLLAAATGIKAQVNCFVRTELDRRSVYAQQPFKITFTVLTATWYTAPLEFENLQVPDAFIVPFDRTLSSMFTINGKQYAGLQFYFIVFPYKPGKYVLPPIKITATTPPVGDYKAEKVTIHTTPQNFIVKPVPVSADGSSWLVAKSAAIYQDWDKPLRNLKVGDVIKRTIVVDAHGTLPQFIPELHNDSLDWAAVYPEDAILKDTRDEYDANGRRIQTFTYLLEKEGDFTMPAATIQWWNPYSSKSYKRSTGDSKIHIAANPDLGILGTIKDSLNARQPVPVAKPAKKEPLHIYGIVWYWFACYAFIVLVILYFLVRTMLRLFAWISRHYTTYIQSERYLFKQFMRSPAAASQVIKRLFGWWDRVNMPDKSASITATAEQAHAAGIVQDLQGYYKEVYSNKSENIINGPEPGPFKKAIKNYRKQEQLAGNQNPQIISTTQQEWPV